MAINNIVLPQKISPAYNPLVFAFSGSNVTEEGYRYVIDIYPTGVATKLASFRIVPQVDETGYIDVSRVLSSNLSGQFDALNLSAITPTNTYLNYELRIGEEFNVTWPYDDFEFYSSGSSEFNAYVQLNQTGSSQAHTYVVGDQINITTAKEGINGLQTVVEVPSAYKIVIGIPFSDIGSGVAVGGTVAYADNRKTLFEDIINNSGYTAYNGAFSMVDFLSYDYQDFAIANSFSSTKRALTNMPNNFIVTPTQDLWLNFLYDTNSGLQQTIRFRNDSGDEFSKAIYTNPFLDPIRQVAVGPNNNFTLDTGTTVVVSGTFPLIKPDTEYYEVYSRRSTGESGKTYRINLDKRCKIEDYEIVFMDRLGSMVSYAFQLRAAERGTIVRTDYKQQLGSVIGNAWTYNTYDRGTTNINTQVDKTLTLNTDWMNDDMSVYFEELLTSPKTFLKVDGIYVACNVVDSAFETIRQKNKNLIRKTITVKYSNQNAINI